MFERIAATPPVVIPEVKMLRMTSGHCFKMSGTSSTDRPKEKEMAMTDSIYNMLPVFHIVHSFFCLHSALSLYYNIHGARVQALVSALFPFLSLFPLF